MLTSPKVFSPLQRWFSLVELIWAHSNDHTGFQSISCSNYSI
jgi:hypothetical protein